MNPFKQLHQGPDVLVLPNAWDAGSARIIEVAGAKAIATSSAAVAWANGYPDGEATPFDLVVATVKEIARVVALPITADVEAGYGDDPTAHVAKVVDAGAQGINIEDGTGSPELLAAKIGKIKTRFGDAVWINARTDVYLHNLAQGEAAYDETVKRARLYREAGADSIFIPMAVEDALIGRFVKAIDAPLNVLAWSGLPPLKRLKELGVRRLSAGSGIAKTLMNQTYVLTQEFLAEGRSEPLTGALAIPGGLNGNMRKG
ncbi:MAG: isocitrate lyase/phosphoenolpyruvate mutase family protein [Alphaproteobacteria bacterium]|nr:isocitrate lyase/phosphoenolpyruvate mutase family protein [Alphaproteobacteria bacterium]